MSFIKLERLSKWVLPSPQFHLGTSGHFGVLKSDCTKATDTMLLPLVRRHGITIYPWPSPDLIDLLSECSHPVAAKVKANFRLNQNNFLSFGGVSSCKSFGSVA